MERRVERAAVRRGRDDDRRVPVVQRRTNEAADGVDEELLGLIEPDEVLVAATPGGSGGLNC
jgi:hypothetical protein